jgi:hypothetical protein
LLADDERVRVLEASRAHVDIHALCREHLGCLECVHALDCLADTGHDPAQVDGWVERVEAELVGVTHVVRQLGGLQQRLAWHTPKVGTVAPDALLLDQGDARAEPSRERRRPDSS